MTGALTQRQLDVLRELDDQRWLRPMDFGGREASHHSRVARQLVAKGLAERSKLHALTCPVVDPSARCRCHGGARYRRTPAGSRAAPGQRPQR